MARLKKGSEEAARAAARARLGRSQKVIDRKNEKEIEKNSEEQSLDPWDRMGKFGGSLFAFGQQKPMHQRIGRFGNERFGGNRR